MEQSRQLYEAIQAVRTIKQEHLVALVEKEKLSKRDLNHLQPLLNKIAMSAAEAEKFEALVAQQSEPGLSPTESLQLAYLGVGNGCNLTYNFCNIIAQNKEQDGGWFWLTIKADCSQAGARKLIKRMAWSIGQLIREKGSYTQDDLMDCGFSAEEMRELEGSASVIARAEAVLLTDLP